MDGINLLPLTHDPNTANNRSILFESVDLSIYGIRHGPWSYNLYSNGDEELYNLDDDPYQLTSVADDPGLESLKASLKADLERLRTCSGLTCR
jgi:hypothetical protein